MGTLGWGWSRFGRWAVLGARVLLCTALVSTALFITPSKEVAADIDPHPTQEPPMCEAGNWDGWRTGCVVQTVGTSVSANVSAPVERTSLNGDAALQIDVTATFDTALAWCGGGIATPVPCAQTALYSDSLDYVLTMDEPPTFFWDWEAMGEPVEGRECWDGGPVVAASPFTCTRRIKWDPTTVPAPGIWLSAQMDASVFTVVGDLLGQRQGGGFKVFLPGTKVVDRPPEASFDVEAVAGDPASYRFLDTSVDPDGGWLTANWDFGDGTTGTGPFPTHTFTLPGTYVVRLTVTNPKGLSDVATEEVVVKAPELSVSTRRVNGTTGPVGLNEEFELDVVVGASADGVGNLTDVGFVESPLDYDETILELIEGPTPAPLDPFELAPGEERATRYRFRALRNGTTPLTSKVRATDAAGTEIERELASELTVGQSPLTVSVITEPESITELAYDSDLQPIPQPVTVTVGITNNSDDDVEDVVVSDDLVLESLLGPVAGVFPLEEVDGPLSGARLGSIAAHASEWVTFSLRAMAPGLIDVRALVTSAAGPAVGSTPFSIATPYQLAFKAQLVGVADGATIAGGTSYDALMTLKNVSDDTLVVRIGPTTTGNAAGGVPTIGPDDPPDSAAGLRVELPPESDPVVLRATVNTIDHGGSVSRIGWTPHVAVVEDGVEAPLDPSAVFTADGSGPYELSVTSSVELPPPPLTVGSGIHLFLDTIGEGLYNTAVGFDALGRAALQNPISADNPTFRWLVEYYTALYHVATDLTAGEWQAVKDYAVEGLVLSGFDATSAARAVDDFVQGEFRDFLATFPSTHPSTWDWTAIISFTGRTVGENIDIVVSLPLAARKAVMRAVVSEELDLTERVLARVAATQEASASARIALGVNFLHDADPLDLVARTRLFGVDPAIDRGLLAIARKWGIVIGVRPRSVAAEAWIRAGALPKPPALDFLKSVNDIDVRFLGYRPVDEGSLVFRPPRPWADVAADLANEPVEVVDAVRARWERHLDAWNTRQDQVARYLDDGIDIPVPDRLDGTYNSVPNFNASVYERRMMQLEPVTMPDGAQGYVVKVADANGELRRVASDVDLAYIGNADGTGLSPSIRAAIGKDLAAIGIQHFESYTFVKTGQRAEILAPFVHGAPGNQALLLYHPSGSTRAARFDPAKSIVGPTPGEPSFLYLSGAELKGPVTGVRSMTIDPLQPVTRPVYLSPSSLRPATPGPVGMGFSHDPDAVVARLGPGNRFETWMQGPGWTQLTDTAHDGDMLPTLPQTSVASATPAGATQLAINDLGTIAPDWPEDTSWFRAGDKVVVNPGGANEETATVIGLGSLLLDAPLRFSHEPGEMVSVMSTAGIESSIRLETSKRSQVYGTNSPVVLTAKVSRTDGASPSGTVTFRMDGAVVATVAVRNSRAVYRVPFDTPAGTHDFVAEYSGSAGVSSATSAPAVVSVTRVSSVAILTTSKVVQVHNTTSPAKLTVRVVTANGRRVEGTVVFRRRGTIVGTATLVDGRATYTVPSTLAVGVHTYTASFAGDVSVRGTTSNPMVVAVIRR